jgi:hypothetical protein
MSASTRYMINAYKRLSSLAMRIILFNSIVMKIIAMAIAVAMLIYSISWYRLRISLLEFMLEDDVKLLLSNSETIILIASLLLIIGLIGEYSDSDRWKKSTLYTVSKLFVIIGVALELCGNELIFGASDRLHDIDGAQITEAKTNTALAIARATDAEKEAAELRQKFSWRRIDPDKFRVLVAELKRTATGIGISTFVDAESTAYADDIAAVLSDAGYDPVARQYFTSVPKYDIAISSESPHDLNEKLLAAFQKAGVPMVARETDWGRPVTPDGHFLDRSFPSIFVGLRPRPAP